MEGADTDAAWPRIGLRRLDRAVPRIRYGETMRFEVAVQLDGLTAGDLTVEMVFTRPGEPTTVRARRYELRHERQRWKAASTSSRAN
jgi:starch phosphorylase